jgi:hypothetical protein
MAVDKGTDKTMPTLPVKVLTISVAIASLLMICTQLVKGDPPLTNKRIKGREAPA